MNKLINFIASVWLFLFVVYPFVATVSAIIAYFIFNLSLGSTVLLVLGELALFIILMATGVFKVSAVGAPMSPEEHQAYNKRGYWEV